MPLAKYSSIMLQREENLLVTGSTPLFLDNMVSMAVQSQGKIGIIGEEFPFLSNLNVLENITLGTMYGQNISLQHAWKQIAASVTALSLEHAMGLRNEMLSPEEMIKGQILRGIACANAVLLLISPTPADANTVITSVRCVPHTLKIWIACHRKVASAYEYLHFSPFSIDG